MKLVLAIFLVSSVRSTNPSSDNDFKDSICMNIDTFNENLIKANGNLKEVGLPKSDQVPKRKGSPAKKVEKINKIFESSEKIARGALGEIRHLAKFDKSLVIKKVEIKFDNQERDMYTELIYREIEVIRALQAVQPPITYKLYGCAVEKVPNSKASAQQSDKSSIDLQDTSYYLVQDKFDASLNSEKIKKIFREQANPLQRLKAYKKLAEMFQKIHDLDYIHEDIKPDNIMVVDSNKKINELEYRVIDFGLTTREKGNVYFANEFFCSPNKVPLGLGKGERVLAEKFDDVYALTMSFMAMEIEIDKVYFGYDNKDQIEITEDDEEEASYHDSKKHQSNLNQMMDDGERKKSKDEIMIDCISRWSSRECRQTIFENCKSILEEPINGIPRNEYLVKIIQQVVLWDENENETNGPPKIDSMEKLESVIQESISEASKKFPSVENPNSKNQKQNQIATTKNPQSNKRVNQSSGKGRATGNFI